MMIQFTRVELQQREKENDRRATGIVHVVMESVDGKDDGDVGTLGGDGV